MVSRDVLYLSCSCPAGGCQRKNESWTRRAHSREAAAETSSVSPRRRLPADHAGAQPSLPDGDGVVRAIWVSPRHAVVALAIGVLCGVLAARVDGMIPPPYAATLGTLVLYPVLVTVWRRIVHFGGWR